MTHGLYNGASLVGLQGIVIKSHGSADEIAFRNALRTALIEIRKDAPGQIGALMTRQKSIGGRGLIYSRIAGTGRYLPERVLTNADLEKMVDTTDEWIRTRTGIERRHICAEDETTCDMSEQAALRAMEDAGVGPEDIDLIIVGTTTPDQVFPNVGCLLQHRLDIHGCPAFSLEAACTGFIYALSVADKFVRSGEARNASGHRRRGDLEDDGLDRSHTCVLFGDGAGAVVLQPSSEPGIISTHIHADGKYKDLLFFPSGVSKKAGGFSRAARLRPDARQRSVQGGGQYAGTYRRRDPGGKRLEKSDIDWLIPHQANIRIIQATAKKLDMPMERVIQTVAEHGNTSTASVPMALDVAVRDGRIKRGEMLLLEAFGGGFTWGSALVRF